MARKLLLAFVIFVSTCVAQETLKDTKLLPEPVCLDGKAVYINKYGEIILKTNFDYFWLANTRFSEGFAGFKENGKYGFIDETGAVVIKPSFDSIGSFSEGFAEIEINKKTGFIDKTGKILIQPQYDNTWGFTNGFALVGIKNGADEEGFVKYKWGFIDKSGKIVVGKTKDKDIGKFDDAEPFSEGLAPVKIGNKWGYVNEKDQIIIKPQFKTAKQFSEELASVTINGKKWGFIDKTGKFIIQPQFTDAEDFSEGLVAVSKDTEKGRYWGFIDKSGKIVIEQKIANTPGNFQEGLSLLFFGSQGFGYADKTGKVVIKLPLGGASSFSNGLARVHPNDYGDNYILYGWGYIDKTGKYIWNPKEKNQAFGTNCNN